MKLTEEEIKLAKEMKDFVVDHLAKEFSLVKTYDEWLIWFADKKDENTLILFNCYSNMMWAYVKKKEETAEEFIEKKMKEKKDEFYANWKAPNS